MLSTAFNSAIEAGKDNIFTIIILLVAFSLIQLTFQRLSAWSWRKTVEKDIEIYKKLQEIEVLRLSEKEDTPDNEALIALKNSIESRVKSGSLRKERLLSIVTTLPMTTIGFIGLGVAIIFLGFTSETNFENFTRNDYSKLAFLYLVAFVLCFLFDIVLTLMRIAFEKIIAAVKDIWLCHRYHKRAQKHYHRLQAALSDNKSAATLIDLEQITPSDEDPSKAERYANLIQRIEEQIETGIAGKEQYWAEVDLLRGRLRELEFKKIEAKMFPTRFDGRIEETEDTIHIIRKIISLLDDSIRISKERLEVLGKSSF